MSKLSTLFLASCIFLTGPLFFNADINTLKMHIFLNCVISFAFTDYIVSCFHHIFSSSRIRNIQIKCFCSICTCFFLVAGYWMMKLTGETVSFTNFSILFAFASATWFGLYCYCHYIFLHISSEINKLIEREKILLSSGYLIIGTILIQVYALVYNMLEIRYTLFTALFVILIFLVYGVFVLMRLYTMITKKEKNLNIYMSMLKLL